MPAVHADAELAPRDVVARAIHRQIAQRPQRVFLDCREAIGAHFADHFPTVYAACMAAGIDPATQPIPVAPAAHYHMGGIAIGCAGPLLPRRPVGGGRMRRDRPAWRQPAGLQFAAGRAGVRRPRRRGRARQRCAAGACARHAAGAAAFRLRRRRRMSLREAMSRHVGLERDADGLREALAIIAPAGAAPARRAGAAQHDWRRRGW